MPPGAYCPPRNMKAMQVIAFVSSWALVISKVRLVAKSYSSTLLSQTIASSLRQVVLTQLVNDKQAWNLTKDCSIGFSEKAKHHIRIQALRHKAISGTPSAAASLMHLHVSLQQAAASVL